MSSTVSANSAQADRRIPPVPLRRSGLPRPSSGLPRPSATSSSSHTRPTSALPRLSSIPSVSSSVTQNDDEQPSSSARTDIRTDIRRTFTSRLSGITSRAALTNAKLSAWINNSPESSSSAYAWEDDEVENVEEEVGWGHRVAAEDESSPFSRQLAKITRGTNEDVWMACQPCIPTGCGSWTGAKSRDPAYSSGEPLPVCRSSWKPDGACQVVPKLMESISKEAVGRRVVIAGAEQGTLRYFGRTAFASGDWCGVELDNPVGKNDGSVDGVIYFTCDKPYGLFAPDGKVFLLPYDSDPVAITKRPRRAGQSGSNINRLSDSSTGSSGGSRTSRDDECNSLGRRSSSTSIATYTLVGRNDDSSLPTSPETGNTYHVYRNIPNVKDSCEIGSSGPASPNDITYDDSSLGILTPDQMPDFTVTGSASFERSPSDEDIAALQDEVCDDDLLPWNSHESVPGVEDDILQRDISVIIQELRKEAEISSSESSSPSLPKEEQSTEVQTSIGVKTFAKQLDFKEQIVCHHYTDENVVHKSKRPLENQNKKRVHIKQMEINEKIYEERELEISSPIEVNETILEKKDMSRVCCTTIQEEEPERESNVSWTVGGNATMTLSAASLDQGYQGDGEFDVPSEAGSATASSPIEDPQLYEGEIDRLPLDANPITEADVSLADDEAESEAGITPRDRAARIIDGKLYHNNREIANLRQADGPGHGRAHDAHLSEMDSSGFYSDLDPREDESTRHDAPALQPLREANLDNDLHDSVLDDTYNDADEDGDEDDECKSDVLGVKTTEVTVEVENTAEEDEKPCTTLLKCESKELTVSTDHLGPSPAPSDITTSPPQSCSSQITIVETNDDGCLEKDSMVNSTKSLNKIGESNQSSFDDQKDAPQAKPRNYNKPWLSRAPPPKKPEPVKKILPPPPPMPKKNVQSKLKALLEAKPETPEKMKPRQEKKGKWDEVMNRIAEAQKEDKTRPKVKEVKSRLMESIKAPAALSPQAERIRQERRERRERRERQQQAAVVAARRASIARSERRRSNASSRAQSRAPSLDSLAEGGRFADSRSSTPDVDQHGSKSHAEKGGVATPRAPSPCPSDVSSCSSQISNISKATRKVTSSLHNHPHGSATSLSSTASANITSGSSGTRGVSRSVSVSQKISANSRSANTNAGDKKRSIETTNLRRPRLDNIKSTIPKVQRSPHRKASTADPVKAARPTVGVGRGPTNNVVTNAPHSEQLKKLEAELSARTAEVTTARDEAAKATRGVEALTVLVHYLTNTYEAFSTPKLKGEIKRLASQLTQAKLTVDESNASLCRLEEEIKELRCSHEKNLQQLNTEHSEAVNQLTQQHSVAFDQAQEKHRQQLAEFTEEQEKYRSDASKAHKGEIERLENDWKTKLDIQQETHIQAIKQLNIDHSLKVKELENNFKAKEVEYEEKNVRLQQEQERLKGEAKRLEETLLSDKDHRLQAVKRVCGSLQQEVDSLKAVIEMRNTEIHKLRSQVIDREHMTEELENARDRIRQLQAKTEDLQAQMDTKSQIERSLYNEHLQVVDSLQRELTASKRLSLENEELQWKLRQREELMSASMPASTLDLVTRSTPPNVMQRSHEGGSSTPPSAPRSPRIMSKSMHAKSSPLRTELNKRWSSSISNIQEERKKEEIKGGRLGEALSTEHISIDSPPPSPCVKAVIEKSNSVSFILDLNDSLSDDSFLDLPPSPRPRSARTPTLQRKALQKSISDKNCSRLRVNLSKDNGLTQRLNGTINSETKFNGSKKNFIIGSYSSNKSNSLNNDLIDSDSPSPLNSLDHVVPERRRCYSTSESSEGGEIERESPTGLSWTVPVRQNGNGTIKRPVLEPPPLHLRQPEEDEYEEINGEREFVEVVALGDVPPNEALSTLLAHTPTSSASPSDSELSQCGSRAELSTESDEETSEDEETNKDSKSNRWWVPQEGAGEAMIPEDILGQYQEVLGDCLNEKKNMLKHVTSGPSSDSEDTHRALPPVNLDGSWSEDVECDLTSSSEIQEL